MGSLWRYYQKLRQLKSRCCKEKSIGGLLKNATNARYNKSSHAHLLHATIIIYATHILIIFSIATMMWLNKKTSYFAPTNHKAMLNRPRSTASSSFLSVRLRCALTSPKLTSLPFRRGLESGVGPPDPLQRVRRWLPMIEILTMINTQSLLKSIQVFLSSRCR